QIVRVRDVMRTEFDIVDGMITVQEAVNAMQHPDNKCLIVKKRDDDDEYGILLISDIARKVLARDRAPERTNVYEVMQKPVIAVDPAMDVRYCARLLEQFEITRTPVIDNGKIVGIVSFTELVLRVMRETGKDGSEA
ncbi:MAG: CBS domain-containing protein, partial [Gammaproteobacteria bacterium]|nr:CBS domain-containing protein [Gammaproteobacteria bacterium]